jgi:chemotaxis signal transduction protein
VHTAPTQICAETWHALARIGGFDIAVALDELGEIGPAPRLTRLPWALAVAPGVTVWRDALLPVVVPHLALGLDMWRQTPDSRALIVGGPEPWCLMVDSLIGARTLRAAQAAPPRAPSALRDIARGWAQVADERRTVWAVLDPALLRERVARVIAEELGAA